MALFQRDFWNNYTRDHIVVYCVTGNIQHCKTIEGEKNQTGNSYGINFLLQYMNNWTRLEYHQIIYTAS